MMKKQMKEEKSKLDKVALLLEKKLNNGNH